MESGNPPVSQVDNSIYDDLGEKWYGAHDNPVAFLRAEARLEVPWIHDRIQPRFPVPQTCQVLDIGCGAGFISNPLAALGYRMTGVDLSGESLSVAKKHDSTGNVEYWQADAYSLPFQRSIFDVVTLMDFLEHVEQPAQVIEEAVRVLKPGGLLFFHTFNRNWLSGFVVIKLLEWFIKNTPRNMHVLHLFIKPDEMNHYCMRAGLKMRETVGLKPNIELHQLATFFRGRVPMDFSFSLTSNITISYLGYASLGGN